MEEGKKCVKRLLKAKCSCGTMENYLNVKKDHGVIWETEDEPGKTLDNLQPLMNACDFVPKENIVQFGRCNSSENMGNKVDFEEITMFLLCPASLLLKKATGCSGCKCKPIITDVWFDPDDSHLVGGVPVITTESQLYCRNGGCIEIYIEEEEEE